VNWAHVCGVVAPALDKATRLSAGLTHRAPLPITVQRHEGRPFGRAPIAGARLIHPRSDRFGQYLFVGHCDHLEGDARPARHRVAGPNVPMILPVW
jgi:hypothetical protein